MHASPALHDDLSHPRCSPGRVAWECVLLVLLMFVWAGDPPPAVNEAHYLVKAKNFWQPEWCERDLFVSSAKVHLVFDVTFGALTALVSLPAAAWIGRLIGWAILAFGLQRLSWRVAPVPYASLLVAAVWMPAVLHMNLAGEWIVGGIEAKVPAYGLVLVGLERMAAGRWRAVWPLLGFASAFHVLVGGWAVVAAAATWTLVGRRQATLRSQLAPLVVGGMAALCGVIPAAVTMAGVEPEVAREAAWIYSYWRIKHHLFPAAFPWAWWIRFGVLAIVAALLAWPVRRVPTLRPVLVFTLAALAIALVGVVIGMLAAVAPDLAARLLRYYWFRLADAAVPLAGALSLAAWLGTAPRIGFLQARPLVVPVIGCLAIAAIGYRFVDRLRLPIPPAIEQAMLAPDPNKSPEYQRRVVRDWRAVCDWVRENTPEDALLLTPRHQQTFKWYAHRAEVVNWKDVPQDAASLVEWRERFNTVFPRRLGRVRTTIRYADLREMRARWGVQWIVVDRRVAGPQMPLNQLYPPVYAPNETFAVYELP